ncbi:MAG TPA: hypothetical protein VFV50_02980 [Bdellovibrionales bacterium]|nr:hypothetical protein [Bdellovibrionales bacterium]
MTRTALLATILALTLSASSNAAILIEDGQAKRTTAKAKIANDGLAMRKVRRVAIGASAAGPLGFAGANLELNFTDRWGVGAGFGGSTNYQAYTFQIKHVLAGEWLLPYMSFGYSKWYTAGTPKGPIRETNPAFLTERFLSPEQKHLGDFSVHLLYPSFGLQYVQLGGAWAGFSVFTEILMLVDVEDFEAVPTGTLGMLYYF